MGIGDLEKRFALDSCFRLRNISTTFGVNNLISFQMQFDIFLSNFEVPINYTKAIYSINFII